MASALTVEFGCTLKTCFRTNVLARNLTLLADTNSNTSICGRSRLSTLTRLRPSSANIPTFSVVGSRLLPCPLSSSSSSSSVGCVPFLSTPSSPFSMTSRFGKAENYYNPYSIADTPEEAAELEPPVRYFKDTRFDEPDYDMPKAQVRALYAEHQPADLFTDFEVSRDPVEWSYVERLLAPSVVPPPPPHPSYPTASGWRPANPDPSLTWRVIRKKDHHYDISVDQVWKTKAGAPGAFQVTTLAGIEGDIWSLHRDAKAFLMARLPAPQKWQKRRVQEIETTVNEVAAKIDFKGIFDKDLTEFLLSKGM